MARTKPLSVDPLDMVYGRDHEGDRHPNSSLDRAGGVVVSTNNRPENEIDALMRCAPGDEPQVSKAEMLHLREVLQDAIERLPERDQYIFNALTVERVSIREVARRLSLAKSYVHRLYGDVCARLGEDLSTDPKITEYLEGT